MSLTINGATNTLTAASGLAIAGNTAVTGTLSASGTVQVTGSGAPAAGLGLELQHAGAVSTVLSFNRTGSAYLALDLSGLSVNLKCSGSTVAAATATGLAVTGTLSATSLISTPTKFGVTGNGSAPTAGNLEIGTNAAGSRWKINAPTGGEIDLDINGTTCLYANGSGAGTLGAVTFAVADTTDATSTTAASLKTAGGLAVVKKGYFGDNIVMASGKGIDFSATTNGSGTTTSEVLSDYEEGTWTPTLTFATPGDLSVVYSVRVGSYRKIGKTVHLQFSIFTSTFTHTTASGLAQVTGLPFTTAVTTEVSVGPIIHQGVTRAGGYTSFVLGAPFSDTRLYVYSNGSGVGADATTAAHWPTGGAVWIDGSITYLTA